MGEVLTALTKLRSGLGIADPKFADRLGPLRVVFDLQESDGVETARAKVTSRIAAATARLPEDQRLAVDAAFSQTGPFRGKRYMERLEILAQQRGRTSRTMRRWADSGLAAVAEALLAGAPRTIRDPHWWTEELKVALVLDGPTPEVLETRRVVAARDGLAELDLAMTITEADADTVLNRVTFDVIYGGVLHVVAMESSDRVRLVLTLPRPLARGSAHEYTVRARLPADHELRAHYVCVPKYPCKRFDLRVRFSPADPPTAVTRLVDVYQRDVQDPVTAAEAVRLDPAGEVRTCFTDLALGRASGLRWRY
ncbi:hypothetical protein Acsp05_72120 [Actinokineospora sp. NBRC 105648]|nr:hypothetical protein Acsp05_72120 [Actinokineospora sp. NBRC 105648]